MNGWLRKYLLSRLYKITFSKDSRHQNSRLFQKKKKLYIYFHKYGHILGFQEKKLDIALNYLNGKE